MKNLKLNIERVINSINGKVTTDLLKSAIQKFESTYAFVDSYMEAEQYFKECGLEGVVHTRENQRIYTRDFEIVVDEYYVDPASIDYVYSVHVYGRD